MDNREIEVRFLEINKDALVQKLKQLSAKELGTDFFKEIIFYDKELKWQYEEKKFVRLRQTKSHIFLTFKHNEAETAAGTVEIETEVSNWQKTKDLLGMLGLIAFREQEKKRESFELNGVTIDIDEWPSIPTYVELEGKSEEDLKAAAKMLGFDWEKAVFESARFVIEKHYKIPVSKLRYFTFDKIE